jgi:hypothetical protein
MYGKKEPGKPKSIPNEKEKVKTKSKSISNELPKILNRVGYKRSGNTWSLSFLFIVVIPKPKYFLLFFSLQAYFSESLTW